MDETETPPASPKEKLKTVIAGFLQERLQAKLDGFKGDDSQHQKLLTAFHQERWIADAAKRVGQIQQVTHALKYTHPDARGSNLYTKGDAQVDGKLVGTHTLGKGLSADVVGNAAALDVYKFLRLAVDGQTLLQRCIAQDPDLAEALSSDGETAQQWMEDFAGLAIPKGRPASHSLAKQIYWSLGNGEYHLLAPLFPTSLADAVWRTVRQDITSDAAKAARNARHNNKPHHEGHRDYPDMALQKFGGTKPQNISQLNSERHGENYLLASLPPNWESQGTRPLLHVASLFDGPFSNRRSVREKVTEMRKFLRSVQWRTGNWDIRDQRDDLLAQLCDELLNYAAQLQAELPPGWTQDAECRLNQDEQCWLDPERTDSDSEFAARYRAGDWQDAIARSFGNWLNAQLETRKMHFDQYAVTHWTAALERELASFRRELAHD